MSRSFKAGYPTVRHVLVSFALVLVISVVVIGGLAVFATRSQDRIAVKESIHLTKSVFASIERRLADQLLDYSYWDEAVDNLVTALDPVWADKNVGIYMHDRFAITTSFVVNADNRPVYGMVEGKRSSDNPFRRFSDDLGLLVQRTRAQPRSAPPKPAAGLISDGRSIHFAAASVLTTFNVEGRTKGDIATDSVLIFTRVLNADMLAEIGRNFLLNGLRVSLGDSPHSAASLPLTGPGGSPLGHLSWQVDSPAGEMLRWLLPLIAVVFLVFAGTAYIFLRKTQAVANTLAENITVIEASEEALRASEEKHRTFAANVAHELRTPLAVLRTQVDYLDDHKTSNNLRRDIDSMSRLVSQLLTMTRLDWVAVEPDDRAELMTICKAVAGHLAPIAIKEGRSIEVTGTNSPVIIRGNAGALEQAVSNLVENAIRYSARNTTVTIEYDDTPSIRVMDRGRGIEPHEKQVMFDRFHRADRRVGGAGLGLSIVRQTAVIHGGSVDVFDRSGGGSIFEIRFPKDILFHVYGIQPGETHETSDHTKQVDAGTPDEKKPSLKLVTGGE